MRLLNLFTGIFLCGSGVSGLFQDSREKELTMEVAHLNKRVERLVIDSAMHAKLIVLHDTIVNVHDSIIIQKKTIEIPVTIPLTGQESLRIAIKEFPKLYDSLAKHKGEIIVTEGLKGNHDK